MYEGATVTKVKGVLNGLEIERWHHRDSHHLHSTFWTTVADSTAATKRVEIDLIANTPERLDAIEKAFSLIDFL